MAIEDIVKKIISDAEQKVKQIINSYTEEAKKIISEKEKELKKKEITEKERIDRASENLKARTVQIAELELRKEILNEKQKIIEQVFEKAEEMIYTMPKEKYIEFIKNKLIQYIETGNEEIIVGEKDKEIITPTFIEELNKEVKAKLRENADLKISNEHTNIEKGVILKQGKIRINCSIKSLMKEAREKCEEKVVKILFKEK